MLEIVDVQQAFPFRGGVIHLGQDILDLTHHVRRGDRDKGVDPFERYDLEEDGAGPLSRLAVLGLQDVRNLGCDDRGRGVAQLEPFDGLVQHLDVDFIQELLQFLDVALIVRCYEHVGRRGGKDGRLP